MKACFVFLFAFMGLQDTFIQSAELTTRQSLPKHSKAATTVRDIQASIFSYISFGDLLYQEVRSSKRTTLIQRDTDTNRKLSLLSACQHHFLARKALPLVDKVVSLHYYMVTGPEKH